MTRDQSIEIIKGAYAQFVGLDESNDTVREDTRLFGGDSPLDSASLVSLIIEVEQQISEVFGTEILIADDRAMSQAHSPFRTIGSLADYIQTLLKENREG